MEPFGWSFIFEDDGIGMDYTGEKEPDTVTEQEFSMLIEDFEQKLGDYKEIYFYRNPGKFNRLYKKLLGETKLKDKITLFSHKEEII